MLATLAPWQKTLLEAAEIIKTRGLRKNGFGEEGEPRCLLGALQEVAGHNDRVFDTAFNMVERAIPDGYFNVADWNDAPERTADDVIRALQAAALT